MDRDGVSQFQLIHVTETIRHELILIKYDRHLFLKEVNVADDPAISIKYSGSLLRDDAVESFYPPCHLIIIFDLHDLIPLAEDRAVHFYLRLLPAFWV